MTLASATLLLVQSFRSWLSARGFLMVLAAALIPLILTGAWVATHQKDVAATSISWTPEPPVEGSPVNFTAVIENKARFSSGAFNATLSVGRVSGSQLIADATNTTRIVNLGPGESTTIRLTWTPRPGVFVVLADADTDDALGEIEEFNNQKPAAVEIRFRTPSSDEGPKTPTNLTGSPGSPRRADAMVESLTWDDADVRPDDNVTFTATIRNVGPDPFVDANLTLRVGQAFSNELFASEMVQRNITLDAGATTTVTLTWLRVPPGVYWVEAFLNVTDAHDPTASNNHVTHAFVVNQRVPPDFKFPEPPEKITIKRFYLDIINFLHIRILLPFIGLFYAAGVLADDRDRGNLVYILTRPVPRWLIPITKFVASFAVASVAVVAGLLATFFLLLGTPEGNVGFLTTPLFISLLALFVYGAFFILLGVIVDRPYLIGIAFVIGWETIAGNFVPWVKNLTLTHHLVRAIQNWPLDKGLQWLPEGRDATDALWQVTAAALGFLVLATIIIRRREFED